MTDQNKRSWWTRLTKGDEELAARLQEQEDRIRELEDSLTDTRALYDGSEKDKTALLQQLQDQASRFSGEIQTKDRWQAELISLQAAHSSLQAELKDLRSLFDQREILFDQSSQAYAALLSEANSLRQTQASLEQEKAALQNQLKRSHELIEGQKSSSLKRFQQLEQLLEETTATLQKERDDRKSLEAQAKRSADELRSLHSQLASLKSSDATAQKQALELQALQKALLEHAKEIESLRAKDLAHRSEITQKQSDLELAQTQIKQAKQTDLLRSSELEKLHAQIASLKLDSQKAQSLQKDLDSLRAKDASSQKHIKDLQTELSSLQPKLLLADQALTLQTQVKDLSSNLTSLQNLHTKASEELSARDLQLAVVSEQRSSLQAQVKDLSSQTSSLQNLLNDKDRSLRDLQASLDKTKTDSASLSQQLHSSLAENRLQKDRLDQAHADRETSDLLRSALLPLWWASSFALHSLLGRGSLRSLRLAWDKMPPFPLPDDPKQRLAFAANLLQKTSLVSSLEWNLASSLSIVLSPSPSLPPHLFPALAPAFSAFFLALLPSFLPAHNAPPSFQDQTLSLSFRDPSSP